MHIASLGLTLFESPLSAAWQSEQLDQLSQTERARLARIERPLRREQFLVGHALLRRVLSAAGFADTRIEVDSDGRPSIENADSESCTYASIAHSDNAVAVIIADEPIGVDLELMEGVRDPRAAAALLGLPADAGDSAEVVRAWVRAEAQMKAGPQARPDVWCSRWQQCLLAVAGTATPPLTLVFDLIDATYNAAELRWEAVR